MSAEPRRERATSGAGIVPLVLAAGFATRLRPLTDDRAKAVVPFLNRPLLDHTLEWLAGSGFRRVVINLHHAPETIRDRYGSSGFGVEIRYSDEQEILGTGGAVRAALHELGDEILIVNGDVFTRAALGPLIRHHRESGALATLGLHRGSVAREYPQVSASPEGRLLAFGDNPGTADDGTVRGVFSGVHLVRREAVDLLPEGRFAGIVDHLYRPLLEAGLPIGAIPLAGSWYEIGDPTRYIDHQLEALRRVSAPLALARTERLWDGGYRAYDGHLDSTRPVPPFLIGSGARVQDGAAVAASVLADRVLVGPGACLRECVLWRDAVVGPGARLERCIVMEGVRVPPGAVASERVFAPEGVLAFGERREATR